MKFHHQFNINLLTTFALINESIVKQRTRIGQLIQQKSKYSQKKAVINSNGSATFRRKTLVSLLTNPDVLLQAKSLFSLLINQTLLFPQFLFQCLELENSTDDLNTVRLKPELKTLSDLSKLCTVLKGQKISGLIQIH